MNISSIGIQIIQAFESCDKPAGTGQFTTYRDEVGVLTIGWGSTLVDAPDLKDGDVWSQAKCDEVFASSLARIYVPHVLKCIGDRVVTQSQLDALVSWTYNTGGPTGSQVWVAVREGRHADVPALLARWNKAGGRVLAGLTRRRTCEGQLYAGNINGAMSTAEVYGAAPSPTAKASVPKPSATDIVKGARATTKAVVTATATAGATHAVNAPHNVVWAIVVFTAVALVFAGVEWARQSRSWA